ncbi:hypothetical protein KNT81_gp010 [Proteus phage phiP4-3]|uniref:Uncharacterized protein n=1 Tax=Proteus phage phiP4-3 TaxID=2065203 RepID=A0A2I6PF62_9CAUD|nr:hypothetical protein KNT81_gp010 [Proteus phage phiP4-3]AUM58368.1 hypothetical protein phiP43_010 [Proteus phage phiP4-3]
MFKVGNGIGATVINGNIKGTIVGVSGGDYPLEIELSPGLKGKFKLEDWNLYEGFSVGDKVVFTKNLVGCESDVPIGEELTIHEIDDSESLSHACVDKYGMIRWFSKEELELKK